MFTTLLTRVRHRFAALRAYRRTLAEIDAISQHELIGLQAYRSDMRATARRRLLGR